MALPCQIIAANLSAVLKGHAGSPSRSERAGQPAWPTACGAALTEFALVVPLFVALIYATFHLTDLGLLRLKAQEIARYGAFALSKRSLSVYDRPDFAHQEAFERARAGVIEELERVYADLDAANHRPPGLRAGLVLAGAYVPPRTSDLRNQVAPAVPTALNLEFAEPLSGVGLVLGALGLGHDLNAVAANVRGRLGLNPRGLLTARAEVTAVLLAEPGAAARAEAMAAHGALRGADLRAWRPRGQALRASGGRRIQTSLVADPWRVGDGSAAMASGAEHPLSRVVAHVHKEAVSCLPGAQLVGWMAPGMLSDSPAAWPTLVGDTMLSLLGLRTSLSGRPPVFSRPYAGPRTGRLLSGQVDIFTQLGLPGAQERGAVRRFETGPFYVHQGDHRSGGHQSFLVRRGPNFMGCKEPERRGCWQ